MPSSNFEVAPKQWALQFIATLPDDCTLEDIQYHLNVRSGILKVLSSSRETDVSHEDAISKARQCLDSVGQANR